MKAGQLLFKTLERQVNFQRRRVFAEQADDRGQVVGRNRSSGELFGMRVRGYGSSAMANKWVLVAT